MTGSGSGDSRERSTQSLQHFHDPRLRARDEVRRQMRDLRGVAESGAAGRRHHVGGRQRRAAEDQRVAVSR